MNKGKLPEGIKKVAVICLLRHKQNWLLLKRNNPPNKGLYTPVGGKLDPYEPPKKAAIREIYEETGIHVEEAKYCGTLVETSPINYNWMSFVYLSDVSFEQPAECNEGELVWIKDEDLKNTPMPVTDLYIYNYVKEDTKFNFFVEYNKKMEILQFLEALHQVNVL